MHRREASFRRSLSSRLGLETHGSGSIRLPFPQSPPTLRRHRLTLPLASAKSAHLPHHWRVCPGTPARWASGGSRLDIIQHPGEPSGTEVAIWILGQQVSVAGLGFLSRPIRHMSTVTEESPSRQIQDHWGFRRIPYVGHHRHHVDQITRGHDGPKW